MQRFRFIHQLSGLLIASLALSACGGGSEPTPMTASAIATTASITENSSATFTITTQHADSVIEAKTLSYTGNANINFSVSGSSVTVTYQLADLGNDLSDSFSVTVSDRDDSVTIGFSVQAKNTSAEAVIVDIEALANAAFNKTFLKDLQIVANSYVGIQHFNGHMSNNAKEKNIGLLAAATASMNSQLYDVVFPSNGITLTQFVIDYHNGVIDESTLESHLTKSLNDISEISLEMVLLTSNIAQRSDITPELPSYSVSFSHGALSGFIGNTDYGSWENGGWVFAPQFSIIKDASSTHCFEQ